LIVGTVCTGPIVYKGSPNLGLDERPAWFVASVTLGVGFGLYILSALFFVPHVHCKVIKKDYSLKIWDSGRDQRCSVVHLPLILRRLVSQTMQSLDLVVRTTRVTMES
jgi:hypothetical protein